MIKVENLRKSFDNINAVDDVSFEVKAGETFGLLGPNGAGKTTTIHCIVGVIKPDSGNIVIKGMNDLSSPRTRKLLGIAPQSLSLYSELTGEENLRFFGKIYGLSGNYIKERIDFALNFTGLMERKSGIVRTYSGGMQRRLNLACALMHDPEILFMDEPTAGVDPQSRNLMYEKIEILKNLGKTIFYTTHYIEEAQRLCSRVAIIDKGKILVLDTVHSLINKYGGICVVSAEINSPNQIPSDMKNNLDGSILRVETKDPVETLNRLKAGSVQFSNLYIKMPDLESVFLNLTGRSLRD